MPRDMSNAEFTRALERNGITQRGDGDGAMYDLGCGTTIPAMGLFGRQVPVARRPLLKHLLDEQKQSKLRNDRHRRRREHEWSVGDRAVLMAHGLRQHVIVVAPPEADGRYQAIDEHGRKIRRHRDNTEPHTRGRWKGPKDLREALLLWHAREAENLRKVEEEIDRLCPELLP